jgi:hypothetical protein
MNSSDRDEENWGAWRSESLGVYEDGNLLDVRKFKRFERVGRSEILVCK